MVDGCQVDFYVLQDEAQENRAACTLALMAWERGSRVFVLSASRSDAEALDEFMWRFPPGRFLPHCPAGADRDVPVVIGTGDDLGGFNPDLADSVIVNLSPGPITDPGRFGRILEIVPASPERRAQSREKFRHYRQFGLDPGSHEFKVAAQSPDE